MEERAIRIAINALGGQGGGVLAGWIVRAGEKSGFLAQSTSVPGVAQRTGATVYYIELFPAHFAEKRGKPPVLALMPAPGDVDVVIAAELMEAGRAVARGFVSERTTLIASTHRDYAIGEKIAPGDGRLDPSAILSAADKAAGRFIAADMQQAAANAGAVISAVLLGALAGSGALPVPRSAFAEAIRETGRAVDSNLAAFETGFALAVGKAHQEDGRAAPPMRSDSGRVADLASNFPPAVRLLLAEGLKRVVDFQDRRYGALYLERAAKACNADVAQGGEAEDWRLTKAVAKHLAVWMSYEDTIRVADLKTRASRFARFREDVRAAPGQIVHVSEYLHPRAEEICDLLPESLANVVMKTAWLRAGIERVFGGERRISTTKLRGFLLLNFMASLRFLRRSGSRYAREQARIEDWLSRVLEAAARDYALACEVAALPRLIKGYGDTHERGLAKFASVLGAIERVRKQPDPARSFAGLREAALADEEGAALQRALGALETAPAAA